MAQQAFISGLNEILVFGAATLLVGALVAFALIRAQDFARARQPAAPRRRRRCLGRGECVECLELEPELLEDHVIPA